MQSNYNNTEIGLLEVNNDNLSIYPNPTQDQLFVTIKDVYTIEVFNQLGVLIKTFLQKESVLMGNFASGMDILKIYNKENQIIKIVKIVKL